MKNHAELLIKESYMALQAERHPTQFRMIEWPPLNAD